VDSAVLAQERARVELPGQGHLERGHGLVDPDVGQFAEGQPGPPRRSTVARPFISASPGHDCRELQRPAAMCRSTHARRGATSSSRKTPAQPRAWISTVKPGVVSPAASAAIQTGISTSRPSPAEARAMVGVALTKAAPAPSVQR